MYEINQNKLINQLRLWSIYTSDTLKTEKNKFFTIHFDTFKRHYLNAHLIL